MFLATALHAQRYRVVVGSTGTPNTSIVEFRPCIPVEGSDCGAWIDRGTEMRTTGGVALPATQRDTTADGRYAISIRDGTVVVALRTGKNRGQSGIVTGLHGKAAALAVSADSQFAFVLTSRSDDDPGEVCMIYLDWRSVFARQTLPTASAGLAFVR
jgi:hypothetical protein